MLSRKIPIAWGPTASKDVLPDTHDREAGLGTESRHVDSRPRETDRARAGALAAQDRKGAPSRQGGDARVARQAEHHRLREAAADVRALRLPGMAARVGGRTHRQAVRAPAAASQDL